MKLRQFEIWDDVFDESLDLHVAPEIGDVMSKKAPKIYIDPVEFFRRTYFTDSMLDILERLLSTLEGRERHNIFLIYSLFGGGKTHTLLTLYHAFKRPDVLFDEDVLLGHSYEKREKIKKIAERIKNLGDVKVVTIYGKGKLGQPSSPLNIGPYQVRTLWGYIAHSLGSFSVVEEFDTNLSVPDVETLRDVFKGKKVLLLMDEIVHYVDNLKHSGNRSDRRYAESIDNFLDTLSTAILGSLSACVITMPVEERSGKLERVEGEYDASLVRAIWSAVRRIGGSELYSPMDTSGVKGELVEVLKKRIFKSIDDEARKRTLDKLRAELGNADIFGRFTAIEDYEHCYPFHPEYVGILREIIERTGLQRTRDMLRITRIIMRKLKDEDFGLIMPHHVDLRDDRIKGMFFGRNEAFSGYSTIVDVDLNEDRLSEFEKPELADFILRYVFLKTFPYDSAVPQTGFPTPETIARGVYDPLEFEKKGWPSVDITDAIKEIEKNSTNFTYLNVKDGVFWFWRVANVSQMVESRRKELLEQREGYVWDKLVERVEKIFRSTRKKKKSVDADESFEFFDRNSIVVSREAEDLKDSPDYKLLVLVKDDVTDQILERIIFRYGTGRRTYANTVTVCFPLEGSFRHLLSTMAKILACDEVKEQIRSAYEEFGKDVVDIQVGMVRNIKNKAEEMLDEQIVNSFCKVAYPKDSKVSDYRASPSSKSIVENVYSALTSEEKIMERLNFDWMKEMLQGVDFKRGIKFKELSNLFYINSHLPMIKRETLEDVVKEAVEELELGVKRQDKIFFKPVYKAHEQLPDKEKGTPPSEILDEDIILPREEAIQEEICLLISREIDEIKEIGGERYRRKLWYEMALRDIGGFHFEPLRRFVVEENGVCKIKDEVLFSLIHGQIIEKVKEEKILEGDFEVEAIPDSFTGKPGEEFDVTVRIKAFGDKPVFVRLSADYGSLEKESVEVEKEVVLKWSGVLPERKIEAVLNVKGPKGVKEVKLRLIPRKEEAVVETDSLEDLKGAKLVSISGIKSLDVFDVLPENISGKVSGNIVAKSPFWKSEFSGVEKEVFVHLVKEMKEFLQDLSFNVELSLEEEVKIDDLLYEKLSSVKGSVVFICRRENG